MKRGLLLVLFLVVALVSQVSFAQVEVAPSQESHVVISEEGPTGCPVHCSQSEACIAQRCVETCRVSCRQGTFCTAAGACQPLPKPEEAILTEEDLQRLSGANSADSRVLVFADLGGILGYGFQFGFEYGEAGSFLARAKFLNTGILNYAAYAENEDQQFDWGFGGSAAYRKYEAMGGNLRGFYYGGGLDYSLIRVTDREGKGVAQLLHSFAPFGEFGYRWVFGSTAVGFGPTLALRYPIGTGFSGGDFVECAPPYDCEDDTSRSFEGTLHFEVGWFQ